MAEQRNIRKGWRYVGVGTLLAEAGLVVAVTFTLTTTMTASAGATSVSTPPPTVSSPSRASNPNEPCWQVVDSPNPLSYADYRLRAVAVVSAQDVWAVGAYGSDAFGVPYRTLTEHWNGTEWTLVPSPNYYDYGNYLYGVAAVSANDVWAVGVDSLGTLVEHWDGTEWTIAPSPNLGIANRLYGVAAVSATDVWAVGYSNSGTPYPLIEHWDGTAWSVYSSLNPGPAGYLYGVAAVSANDVWAVGSRGRTLVEHWNGAVWSVVSSPNPYGSTSVLYGVAGLSSTDVWVVGYYSTEYCSYCTLIEHWDGSAWTIVDGLGTYGSYLYGVSAVSADDVWAVGYSPYEGYHVLVKHWNGSAWSVVSTPVPGIDSRLQGVAAVSVDDVWAVGYYFPSGARARTLVGHLGTCLPPTPTATPTTTPTTTPTARCPGQVFSDVCPEDYFYEPVMFLYYRGVVSGYADGTFRPYNNTTRGQLTKIIVLAEGWPIVTPTGTPTFSDVPADNPFFQYVETAVSHKVISGYSDGTFRPGNDVTRGQLTKIIVLARGWAIDTAGGPHFSDVPEGSTFYGYVETAYNHDVISGYSDGTFRPGYPATRGQISKIVYLAVTGP